MVRHRAARALVAADRTCHGARHQVGLFGYYWVVISFVLTVFATTALLIHMPTVTRTADVGQQSEGATRRPR